MSDRPIYLNQSEVMPYRPSDRAVQNAAPAFTGCTPAHPCSVCRGDAAEWQPEGDE